MSEADAGGRRGLLPGLLGLVAAALLWWLADGWRADRATVDQQIATSQRLLRTESAGGDQSALVSRRAALKQFRASLNERLSDEADLQLIRARMLYDIRQRCYDVKLNCLVRLGDISTSGGTTLASGGTQANRPARNGTDPLADLGVERVRASVSGLLGEQDIADVLLIFARDESRVWRINRVQVKGQGRTFEIDIERHVLPTRKEGA